MHHSLLGRRTLLKALGLGTTGLFLPSLLGRRKAGAQAGAPAKRIIFFLTQHGTVRENWWMRRNNPEYQNYEYAFDDADPASFSQILAPLHPYRSDLLVLEGLAQVSTLGDSATNNHDAAVSHLMCCENMVRGDNAGGPSVDQLIASEVAQAGRIPSVEFADGNPWKGGFLNTGPDKRVPVESSPERAFERLFAGTGQNTSEGGEAEDLAVAERSVLDLVQGEYDLLLPKLAAEDRQKLEMHRDIVRDLEQRITVGQAASCDSGGRPVMSGGQDGQIRAFMDLAALAFACDLTRVVTIQATQLDNGEFGAPPGDVHQDYAHETYRSAEAANHMTTYNEVHAKQFAHLVEALASYSDGEGRLLDNTVAVWLTELATGPHELDKIPVVMAGSCGGAFTTGRYISYAQDLPNPHQFPDWGIEAQRPVGPGHSHLHVSLMQAMGLSRNSIGLAEVKTRDGTNQTLDLTGPLPRLSA